MHRISLRSGNHADTKLRLDASFRLLEETLDVVSLVHFGQKQRVETDHYRYTVVHAAGVCLQKDLGFGWLHKYFIGGWGGGVINDCCGAMLKLRFPKKMSDKNQL